MPQCHSVDSSLIMLIYLFITLPLYISNAEVSFLTLQSINFAEVNSYFKQCKHDMDKMAEKVDDHLQPIPQEIMGSVTRTDPETLSQYEEIGRQWRFSKLEMLKNVDA